MSEFEEYIKVNYPRDYDRQKRIYPDQNVEELYSEDYKMWQHQQAKIDLLEVQLKGAEERAKLTLDHKNKMVDELQKKYDAMYNAFIIADDCRKEWYESYMSARKDRDELQARVDGAIVKWIAITSIITTHENNLPDEFYQKLDELHCALILKGNKDEN